MRTAVRFGPALALCGLPSILFLCCFTFSTRCGSSAFLSPGFVGVLESQAGNLASPGAVTGAPQNRSLWTTPCLC